MSTAPHVAAKRNAHFAGEDLDVWAKRKIPSFEPCERNPLLSFALGGKLVRFLRCMGFEIRAGGGAVGTGVENVVGEDFVIWAKHKIPNFEPCGRNQSPLLLSLLSDEGWSVHGLEI